MLDGLIEEVRKEEKEKYPYAEWERKRELVKEGLRKLPDMRKDSFRDKNSEEGGKT